MLDSEFMKNTAAVSLGKLRWAKRTKAERIAHGKMMVAAREARKPRKTVKASA